MFMNFLIKLTISMFINKKITKHQCLLIFVLQSCKDDKVLIKRHVKTITINVYELGGGYPPSFGTQSLYY
jgi:hypothetical protein